MKIRSLHHGYSIDGNYVPTWLAVFVIAGYAWYKVVYWLVKGSVWLCKRISATLRARRGRREAERLRGLRMPYNRVQDDRFNDTI
jgi:hypothetical protein